MNEGKKPSGKPAGKQEETKDGIEQLEQLEQGSYTDKLEKVLSGELDIFSVVEEESQHSDSANYSVIQQKRVRFHGFRLSGTKNVDTARVTVLVSDPEKYPDPEKAVQVPMSAFADRIYVDDPVEGETYDVTVDVLKPEELMRRKANAAKANRDTSSVRSVDMIQFGTPTNLDKALGTWTKRRGRSTPTLDSILESYR